MDNESVVIVAVAWFGLVSMAEFITYWRALSVTLSHCSVDGFSNANDASRTNVIADNFH